MNPFHKQALANIPTFNYRKVDADRVDRIQKKLASMKRGFIPELVGGVLGGVTARDVAEILGHLRLPSKDNLFEFFAQSRGLNPTVAAARMPFDPAFEKEFEDYAARQLAHLAEAQRGREVVYSGTGILGGMGAMSALTPENVPENTSLEDL